MSSFSVPYGHLALSNFLQLVQSSSHARVYPEQILSLAGEVIGRIEQLTAPQTENFLKVLNSQYGDLWIYAQSSSIPAVKKTALKCALLMEDTVTILDLSHEIFMTGDEGVIFQALDYIKSIGAEDLAKPYLHTVWDAWYKKMVQIEPIQDSNRDFLGRFCSYVLRFGEMELAHTIIRVLEGSEVEISHKHILTYKKEVTTPEDFELASEEIRLYYLSGSSTVISPALLKSLKEFIQYQMLYVETHQEIEPEMLEYFQGDVTDDGYDLTTEEGREYFYFQLGIMLAVFYADARMAEYILSVLKKQPEYRGLIADIMLTFPLSEDGSEYDDQSSGNIVFRSLLASLAKSYLSIEYREIQASIIELMKECAPKDSEDIVSRLEGWMSEKTYWLYSNPKFANIYLPITEHINDHLSPIRKMHLLRMVLLKRPLVGIDHNTVLIYYVMEYFLYNGYAPQVEDSLLQHIRVNTNVRPIEKQFLEYFYPKQFSQQTNIPTNYENRNPEPSSHQ